MLNRLETGPITITQVIHIGTPSVLRKNALNVITGYGQMNHNGLRGWVTFVT